jgi:DnaJ-class molecular chaperone
MNNEYSYGERLRCPTCYGREQEDGLLCFGCDGTGQEVKEIPVANPSCTVLGFWTCSTCQGRRSLLVRCRTCEGAGEVSRDTVRRLLDEKRAAYRKRQE